MGRSLIHYWRINLAVIAGAIVATSVLTGALLVGDSVRGSLRDLTNERLGEIDFALQATKYFREDLLVDITDAPGFRDRFESIASVILLDANANNPRSRTRASGVNLVAVDEQFVSFFKTDTFSFALLQKPEGQRFPSVIINESLQKELGIEPGEQIMLSFEKPGVAARGSLLGEKNTDKVIENNRFVVTAVVPDRNLGRFGLTTIQTEPMNAFVEMTALQRTLNLVDRVNTIVVAARGSSSGRDTQLLQAALDSAMTAEDIGVRLNYVADSTRISIESAESILSTPVETVVKKTLQEMEMPALPVYTYLANSLRVRDRTIPYSTIASLNPVLAREFGTLELTQNEQVPELRENEILLNAWAAQDLQANRDDTLTMSYFTVGAFDQLVTDSSTFVVKGIMKMQGLAVDRTLSPDFPGIAEMDNMGDWDAPFPVDLSSIRQQDEEYWDTYRATPKAFVSEETGRKLWGSRFGQLTSIRIAAPGSLDLEETEFEFRERLRPKLNAAQFGFSFQPVREQGLSASQGATDFSGLFIGFSLFLIVSAGLIVALLFRLGVEQRAKEIGLLLAVGYSARQIGRRLLKEGSLLAFLGAVLGTLGAILYSGFIMYALRTWWVAATGSTYLSLHVTVVSLAFGSTASLAVIVLSIWLAFRKIKTVPAPLLLGGVTSGLHSYQVTRLNRMVAVISAIFSLLLCAAALVVEKEIAVMLFFGVGALALTAGLAFFRLWLRRGGAGRAFKSQFEMARRNAPRNPGRSLLSTSLVSCAAFVIVAVAANRRDFGSEVTQKDSGAGGFTIIAESDVPIHHNLASESGRFELGFSDSDSRALDSLEIYPMRLKPGDNTSCLNLYRIVNPRIAGVPDALIDRGGFSFTQTLSRSPENPWQLLTQDMEEDVIPAFGDANSVQWILHSGLGKDVPVVNEFGKEVKLRFVGLFAKSIFQSEILISEGQFLKHFPSRNGYSYFLLDAPFGRTGTFTEMLEGTLSDYGLDATTTTSKLASFQAVENTYLSTFQTLGGLGLLLGTIGLGVILMRNVMERRGELAALRAFGFRRRTLAFMVVAENGFLLSAGIAIGATSALLAVAPNAVQDAAQIPWISLLLTLAMVFAAGMLSSVLAARSAMNAPLIPALRAD